MRAHPTASLLMGSGLVLAIAPMIRTVVPAAKAYWALPAAESVTPIVAGAMLFLVTLVRTRRWNVRAWVEQSSLVRVISATWAAVLAIVVGMVTGVWWLLGAPLPEPPPEFSLRLADQLVTRAFAVIAGLGAAALLVINYRRQRTTEAEDRRAELTEKREVSRLFTDRFAAASEQLGSDQYAIRLAGAYAMAHVADTAPSEEEAQTAINVLCAQLKTPYIADGELSGTEHHNETSFRQTIVQIIRDHIRRETRWRGKDFDFTGATFKDADFSESEFTGGNVSFRGATFLGFQANFGEVKIRGGRIDFTHAKFETTLGLNMELAEFYGGFTAFAYSSFKERDLQLSGALFEGGRVIFKSVSFTRVLSLESTALMGGSVLFDGCEFLGNISLRIARSEGGWIRFHRSQLQHGTFRLRAQDFTEGTLSFARMKFFGGVFDFSSQDLRGGKILFSDSTFDGTNATFKNVELHGCEMLFSHTEFNRGSIVFDGVDVSEGLMSYRGAKFGEAEVMFMKLLSNKGGISFAEATGTRPQGLEHHQWRIDMPEHWLQPSAKDDGA